MQQTGVRGGVAYWVALVVVVLVVLALGVSWRYGWFPFAGNVSQQEKEIRVLLEQANAPGTPTDVPADVFEQADKSGEPGNVPPEVFEQADA